MRFHTCKIISHFLSAMTGCLVTAFLFYNKNSPQFSVDSIQANKIAAQKSEQSFIKKYSKSLDVNENIHIGVPNKALIDEFQKSLEIFSRSQRARRFIFLLETMRPEDASEIRKLFLTDGTQHIKFELEWDAFWARWGEIDAKAAMDDIKNTLHGKYFEDKGIRSTAGLVMRSWGASDHASAKAWFNDMDIGEASNFGIIEMIGGWAENDLWGALDYIISPDVSSRIREYYLNEVTKTTARKKDKSVFEKYLRKLPDMPSRAVAMQLFVGSQLQDDPYKARYLVDLYPDLQWKGRDVLPKLVMDLSEIDPADATQWATRLQASIDDKSKAKVVFRSFVKWLEMDMPSATSWLTTQNGQLWYEPAVLSTAEFLIKANHPEAAAWIDSVSDSDKKYELNNNLKKGNAFYNKKR